jgi:hypothetical protein
MTESEAELTPCIQLSTARSPPQPPQPAEPAEPAAIAKMTQTACTPSACSELVSRAEALVKAHMAQCVPCPSCTTTVAGERPALMLVQGTIRRMTGRTWSG